MSEFRSSIAGIKKYRMTLEVEITVPQHATDPKLSLRPDEIQRYLLQTKAGSGYAVCSPDGHSNKLTASMNIVSARFEPMCSVCGTHAVVGQPAGNDP